MFNYLKNFLFVSFIFMMPYMNLSLGAMDDEKKSITHTVKLGKPGPEEWKDSSGNPAPANVRRAADNLWDAVESEGAAAGQAGWGQKDLPPHCACNSGCCCENGFPCWCRVLCCLPSCGLMEYGIHGDRADIPGANGDFVQYGYGVSQANTLIWNQRTTEMKERLKDFKEAVNISVLKPEGYVGDANFCTLGPWVPDGKLSWGCSGLSGAKFHSGRRDLSSISQSTMEFVNKHGGWNTKAEQPLLLKTEMRGNTLHVDF